MPPLFYVRFGYKPTKRFYWYLRVDYIGSLNFKVMLKKHENCCWDLNALYDKLKKQLEVSK
jgi:hypothetical protein